MLRERPKIGVKNGQSPDVERLLGFALPLPYLDKTKGGVDVNS